MKDAKVSIKLHQAIKSTAVSLIIFFLAISLSGFKSKTDIEDLTKSSSEKKSSGKVPVKSLISGSTLDFSKPYAIQLNRKAVPFVKKYIASEGARLEKMKIWGKGYFEMYDRILSDYGLPKELKYLSVIESDLISKAVSVSGAVGPWQIMAEEATRMGLRINSRVDERKNFKKSTHAAAKILKELYTQFNDWTLVIAAYNCGAGRVRKAIRKSGSRNFWYLQAYLPRETRCHVKRFMGTHYIFEGSGGLTTMTATEVKHYKLKVAAMQVKQLREAEVSIVSNLDKLNTAVLSLEYLKQLSVRL
ncbi:MAG: lytic transglycosylase protein [Segetibacter sp.]|nr:lytic transglycosylase protein [Segetibacter sp.]